MSIKVGDTINFIRRKDFEVLNPNLGGGSFGKTIIIRDNYIDEIFVCKKYDPYDEKYREQFYKTFVSEIKIMHALYHENIVRIYNYYLYPEIFTGYIIMEFIDGIPIDKYMASDYFKIFSEPEDIFRQLVEAFLYLEKNKIIHRDIRPGNILVTKTDIVKLIDFGFGKSVNEIIDGQDTFNSIINRAGMDQIPEEFDKKYYDSMTDMFCVAELFNRLLKSNSITSFKYTNILKKMMKTNRSERYQSFDEIKKEINQKQIAAMEISADDKRVYQNFTNSIFEAIANYIEAPVFEMNISTIMKKMKDVISNNIMEDNIQRNEALINVFINSPLNFYPKKIIDVLTVQKFSKWFEALGDNDKKVILDNIIHKLGKIKIKSTQDDDLPF